MQRIVVLTYIGNNVDDVAVFVATKQSTDKPPVVKLTNKYVVEHFKVSNRQHHDRSKRNWAQT